MRAVWKRNALLLILIVKNVSFFLVRTTHESSVPFSKANKLVMTQEYAVSKTGKLTVVVIAQLDTQTL